MTTAPARSRRGALIGAAQGLAGVAVLAVVVARVGAAPVAEAASSLTPPALAGALALGAVGALAQGLRWRLVAAGLRDPMSRAHAVARCYEAAFLNAVLPGGLAGDAVRAARRRLGHDASWASAVWAVTGERLCGTVVALAAAAAGLAGLNVALAAAVGLAALVAAVVAGRAVRALPARHAAGVWGLSLAGWAAYLALFLLAADRVGVGLGAADLLRLGAVTVGGMSIPLSVAGWGPREGAAVLAFEAAGAGAALGLATSVAYGLLALVSVLPGGVLLVHTLTRRRGRGGRCEDELGAHVLPEHEAP